MNKARGRPKVENPRNIPTSINLDRETLERLKEYCEKNGVTKSTAVREGINLLLNEEDSGYNEFVERLNIVEENLINTVKKEFRKAKKIK